MSTGYRVHPDALDAYAARLRDASDRIYQIDRVITEIQLPGTAFGMLPDAEHLNVVYAEHAGADTQDRLDLAGGLSDIAQALKHTAQTYRDLEGGTAGAMGGGRA